MSSVSPWLVKTYSANIENSAATLDAGVKELDQKIGILTNQYENIPVIKGPQGDKGEKGDTGPQGPEGDYTSFTGNNAVSIPTRAWYTVAVKYSGFNEYERLYEFMLATNDYSGMQMKILFSPRISSTGSMKDSRIVVSGHLNNDYDEKLGHFKFVTFRNPKTNATGVALCLKAVNSAATRSVVWNVRSVRSNGTWKAEAIQLSTLTVIDGLALNSSASIPATLTTDRPTISMSSNAFAASLPITAGGLFDSLTSDTVKPSRWVNLSCGGSTIKTTGGSWTSSWKQTDAMYEGNGMLDVTASFSVNVIDQYTYVPTITGGTVSLCGWDGTVVASKNFGLPKTRKDSLTATLTDNVSLRFVVSACANQFSNGLKVVITLPSNYTIDSQVSIGSFTLSGIYWSNSTGYNAKEIRFDS